MKIVDVDIIPLAGVTVGAGRSEPFWPHGLKWAQQTGKILADYEVRWFEER